MTTKADAIITNSINSTGVLTMGSTGSVTIGNLQTTGTIEIGNGANRTSAISIGTGTGNGTITIGSATHNTTIGGNLDVTDIRSVVSTPLPITSPYTTLPTFTSNHIGYRLFARINTQSANLTSAQNFTAQTLTLPIGVWEICYNVRIVSSGTTNVTRGFTTAVLTSTVTINSITLPNNYGLQFFGFSHTVTTTNRLTISGSGIISNNVASNVLNLICQFSFTGSTLALSGTTTPSNYMTAIRIA
jgi:hypothetical protein